MSNYVKQLCIVHESCERKWTIQPAVDVADGDAVVTVLHSNMQSLENMLVVVIAGRVELSVEEPEEVLE